MAAVAPVAAVDRLTSDGASDSWLNNKANQLRLGDVFLQHISRSDASLAAKWATSWAAIPEQYAASRNLYEIFAHWLTRVYVKRDETTRNAGTTAFLATVPMPAPPAGGTPSHTTAMVVLGNDTTEEDLVELHDGVTKHNTVRLRSRWTWLAATVNEEGGEQ